VRELDIAMAMINQVDVYHLQRRTGSKAIGAAGLVGCFGGKIEANETAAEAVARELPEETNLSVDPNRLKQIENFDVESDNRNEPVKVHVKVFSVFLPLGQEVIAKEGELVSWTMSEIQANEDKLTPATKEFFRRWFE
jgi:8-oxo-dGTP pyrophosphatase MutT (NUDIX family)